MFNAAKRTVYFFTCLVDVVRVVSYGRRDYCSDQSSVEARGEILFYQLGGLGPIQLPTQDYMVCLSNRVKPFICYFNIFDGIVICYALCVI